MSARAGIADLPAVVIEPIIRLALTEDFGLAGDITAQALLDPALPGKAAIVARRAGVVAGLEAAQATALLVDPTLRFAPRVGNGAAIAAGETIAVIEGTALSLLAAERVMLNFLCRLSGIATLTAAYVAAIAGTGATIACTRKTTPGLRALEKRAVLLGGGVNHRFSLADAILIKDNHIAAAGSVSAALERARRAAGHLVKIEIEVDRLDQLRAALAFRPDVVMLDNFSLADLAEAVAMAGGQTVLEASGGVSLETVRAIAETGVDVISVGALTHSAPALDLGLDWE